MVHDPELVGKGRFALGALILINHSFVTAYDHNSAGAEFGALGGDGGDLMSYRHSIKISNQR